MNATTINRAEVMTTAWAKAREMMEMFGYAASQLRSVFAQCLSEAWAVAKAKAADAALSIEMVAYMIVDLENRDTLGREGLNRLSQLRVLLREKRSAQAIAERAALIKAAPCTVTFIKADGTARTMNVSHDALRAHVKGADATEAGQKATATRKARHPHLLPVWDADKDAPRSINLTTLRSIVRGSMRIEFAA